MPKSSLMYSCCSKRMEVLIQMKPHREGVSPSGRRREGGLKQADGVGDLALPLQQRHLRQTKLRDRLLAVHSQCLRPGELTARISCKSWQTWKP